MGQEWDLAKDDDVYIVGACRRLFKNGVSYLLGDPRIRFGNSVFVSGDDVYIACDTYPQTPRPPGVPGATLWKNGEFVSLEKGADYESVARADCVAGSPDGNVYGAGNKEFRAALGENEKFRRLGDANDGGEAWCIAVSGKDVYVGGQEMKVGALWTNGVKRAMIPDGYSRGSEVHSVFASGDDLYAVVTDSRGVEGDGNIVFRPWLWKNGVFQRLPDSGRCGANATDVFVSDGDVYVAGSEIHNGNGEASPVLWKNGVQQKLPYDGPVAWVETLSVSGGNVYVGGGQHQDNGETIIVVPTLWINGEAVDLRPSGMTRWVFSVFVVPKGK
jgi:hypothetical protein